ncbi:MAG: DNRLRE domain-containing protein [Anaerolineaceae bacterium]
MGLIRNNLLKIINPQLRLLVVLLLVVSALSIQVQLVRADDYIVEFQDGLNGYGGTLDTFIWASEPDVDHSNSITIVQDEFPGDELRSLLRFELSSIPADATITSAELQFYVSEEGEGFDMHRMLVSWNEDATYNSIGGRHFAPDGTDAEISVNANWPGNLGYTGLITVPVTTSTIQGWIDGTLPNYGWLMIASNSLNGQEIYSSENLELANRPKLTVSYSINESPTDITLSSSTVEENSAINTVVGTLSRSDPDTGNTFTYSLVPGTGDTDNLSFNILDDSLRTSAVFDFETKSSYSVRIRTTDQGGLTFDKVFTISVSDVNESPTDIALSSNTVVENSAIDTVVGTLSSSDPDTGNTFTYSLVPGTGDTDNSSFNILDDSLRTSAIFDFETKSSYSIRIRTTDQGGLFYEEAFTITISDVNESPTDIALSSNTVVENSVINTVVGTLSSSDPDAGNTFAYSLVPGTGDTDNSSFNVLDDSLRTSAVFDFETKSSYSVRIRTTDQGGLFYEEVFTITISDVNESPTDITLSSSTIAENSAIDTVVGALSSSDPDAGNTFTYSLVPGTGDTDNLSFNISSNSLRTSAVFDFETKSSYSVRIRTTDQGGLTFDKVLTILIADINDAPIITGQIALATPKNTSLVISLADLIVTDQDNTYPTDFTLTVLTGTNYTLSGNTITPSLDFIGTLNVPVKVNDGLVDSNTFNLSVNVTNLTTVNITNIYGQTVTLQAFFSPAINNKTVSFSLNGAFACSDTTDSTGHALCNATLLADFGTYPTGVLAVFNGDDVYPASSATARLIVLRRNLTVNAIGVNKEYDGTTNAEVTLTDDRVAGDNLIFTYTNAIFSDNENVGTTKPINVSGISMSGPDSGNYNLQNTTTTTTADIIPKIINVTADPNQHKLFGSPDPVFTYTYSPNNPPIQFTGMLSRDSGEDIGDYNITIGTLSVGSNYTISFISDMFSIVRAYKILLPLVLK